MTASSSSSAAAEQAPSIVQVVKEQTRSSSSDSLRTTAQDWYAQGERVWYDPRAKQIVSCASASATTTNTTSHCPSLRQVFCRAVVPPQQQQQQQQRWMTFLPGNPEGSYGFHQVEEALSGGQAADKRGRCDTDSTEMSLEESVVGGGGMDDASDTVNANPVRGTPDTTTTSASCDDEDEHSSSSSTNELSRLYLDYLGQGDSDNVNAVPATTAAAATAPLPTPLGEGRDPQQQESTPPATHNSNNNSNNNGSTSTSTTTSSDSSSTKQRADLVEAHWHAHKIQRTVVVSVGDASSLVVMELLQRQRARLAAGTPFPKILHTLLVNGRYVAKTRHTSQLPAVTQLLRSERLGPALAASAQRSDFTLGQCLQPYFQGLSSTTDSSSPNKQHARHVRQQVAHIVRRHEGAASVLQDMARTVDDHLQPQHKYRWHLPRLFQVFGMNQGITFQLVTTNRHAQRQTHLVRDALATEYDLHPCDSPGIRYEDLSSSRSVSNVSSTAYLLGSNREQLQPLLDAIQRLANEEIPMSDNSHHHHQNHDSFRSRRRLFHNHNDAADHDDDDDGELEEEAASNEKEDDSWQVSESDLLFLQQDDHDDAHLSQDTRLHTEIMFDTADSLLGEDKDDFVEGDSMLK